MATKTKTKQTKTYLFITILMTAFTVMLLSIAENYTTLAIVSMLIGVITIVYGLFNVLDVSKKKINSSRLKLPFSPHRPIS
jgi:uncharacterized membrane protein HdeD (DUF308 family)